MYLQCTHIGIMYAVSYAATYIHMYVCTYVYMFAVLTQVDAGTTCLSGHVKSAEGMSGFVVFPTRCGVLRCWINQILH